jgi:hypothetical protein
LEEEEEEEEEEERRGLYDTDPRARESSSSVCRSLFPEVEKTGRGPVVEWFVCGRLMALAAQDGSRQGMMAF